MSSTTSRQTVSIPVPECPKWCEQHCQEHEATREVDGTLLVPHSLGIGFWLISTVSHHDSAGAFLEMDEPEVSPEFVWATSPDDIREIAADLVRCADALEG